MEQTMMLPSSYSPLRYLSYPSPSSSMDAVRYASSPLDSLSSQGATQSFNDPALRSAGDRQRERMISAPVHAASPLYAQRDIAYQRYNVQAPSNTHPWSRSIHSTLGPSRAPSSFSSDIEMASSINSFGEEDEHEGDIEQEITLNLGENRAGVSTAYRDAPDDVQLDLSTSFSTSAPLSAFASVQIGTPNLALPSTDSAFPQSPVHEPQLSLSATVLLSTGSSPSSTPFASDSISSGSDYEATVKHKRPNAKHRAPKNSEKKTKPAVIQVERRDTKTEEPITDEVPIKRRKRTIQQKGGGDMKDRIFQCEFCPMSFQRRHDMKR
ncbi:hypothetical protein NCC49_000600 [Naganishia albida]|nr:hypothetical protein NCC49_000600 [Naganishia albida]